MNNGPSTSGLLSGPSYSEATITEVSDTPAIKWPDVTFQNESINDEFDDDKNAIIGFVNLQNESKKIRMKNSNSNVLKKPIRQMPKVVSTTSLVPNKNYSKPNSEVLQKKVRQMSGHHVNRVSTLKNEMVMERCNYETKIKELELKHATERVNTAQYNVKLQITDKVYK